jgi:hypothetical protein
MGVLTGIGRGAAAGAAGTTALNAATYLDMALRGRPASTTPRESVERLADRIGVDVPGNAEERKNRLAGLGPMLGVAAGIGAGAMLGLARGFGWRPRLVTSTVAATLIAFVAGNGPMTVLGVSNVTSWSPQEWVADVAPHAAYGLVAAAVLAALDDSD